MKDERRSAPLGFVEAPGQARGTITIVLRLASLAQDDPSIFRRNPERRVPSHGWEPSRGVDEPRLKRAIRIDSAVTQEGPVLSRLFDLGEIALDNQTFITFAAGAGDDFAERSGDKRVTPELKLPFAPDAVHRRDIDPVGDRMGALDQLPGLALVFRHLARLVEDPADGGRIEKYLRARQGRQSSGLGKPLVPANQPRDFCVPRLKSREAQVAGGEIEFFVVERVVRDMHLAILAGDGAVGVDYHRGVVVDPGRAFFEERGDDDDFFPARNLPRSEERRVGKEG